MPPPFLCDEEDNEYALPIPAFIRPATKIGLVVYSAVFICWLVHTIIT